jgi:hypothetical protein
MGRIKPRKLESRKAYALDDAPEKSAVAKYMDVIRAIKGTIPLVDPVVKGIRRLVNKPDASARSQAAARKLEDGLTPGQRTELNKMRDLEKKRAAAAAAAQPMSGPGLPQTGILPGSQFFGTQGPDSKPVVPLGGEPFPRMGFSTPRKTTRGPIPNVYEYDFTDAPFQTPDEERPLASFDRSLGRPRFRTTVTPRAITGVPSSRLKLDPRLSQMLNVPGEDPSPPIPSEAREAGIRSLIAQQLYPGLTPTGKSKALDGQPIIRNLRDENRKLAGERIGGPFVQGDSPPDRVLPASVPSIPETRLESPFLRPEPADLPERPSDMPAMTPTVLPVPEGARLGQEPGAPMPTIPTEVGGVKVPMKDGRIDIAQLGKMFREKNVTDRKAARGDSALPEDLSQYSLTELRAIRKLAKTPADIRRLGAAARARGEYEMPPGLLGSIAGESGARAGEQYVLRELPAPMTESQRRLALLKVRKLLAEGRNIEAQALLRRAQAAEKAENIPLLRSKTQLNSARAWDIMRKAMRKRGRGRKRLPGLPDGTEIKVLPPKSPGNPTSISRRVVVFSSGATPEQRKNPEALSKMSKIQGKINTITDKQFEDAARKEGKQALDYIKFFLNPLGAQGGKKKVGSGGTERDSTLPNEGKKKGES